MPTTNKLIVIINQKPATKSIAVQRKAEVPPRVCDSTTGLHRRDLNGCISELPVSNHPTNGSHLYDVFGRLYRRLLPFVMSYETTADKSKSVIDNK